MERNSSSSKIQFSSNPNVSSLTTNEILNRHEVKKSRQPVIHSTDSHKVAEKPYHSADNIHEDKNNSKESVIRKTLEKLNMTPASRTEGLQSQNQLIHKLSLSIAAIIDESTSPSEFNHVREGIIMQKITDISSSRVLQEEGSDKKQSDQLVTEENVDIRKLLSITHKSRETIVSPDVIRTIPKDKGSTGSKKGILESLFPNMFMKHENSLSHDPEKVDFIHANIDWSPLIPDPKNYIQKSYSFGTVQRLRKLRVLYNHMKDPEKGIKYISGTVSRSKYLKNWFTGDQLITWLQEKLVLSFTENALGDNLIDAMTVGQLLFHLGFIVSVDRSLVFIAGDKQYIFQAQFFLPNELGSPSNWDYARYLLRRSYYPHSKYKLLPWEITNLDMLGNLLAKEWKRIEKQVDQDISFLSKRGKIHCRIFKLQELRFWSVQRSAPESSEIFLDEEAHFLKKQRLHGNEYEKKFSNNQDFVLSWNEKKVEQLKLLQNLKFTKVSFESSHLIEHCVVTSLLDPFLFDPCPSNPWITDEEKIWDPTRPITVNEIKYWKSGLYFLLMDKRGMDLFWEFCKKEFSEENLKFITACRELQKSTTIQIFDRKAKYIYLEFIKQGAISEINIGSNIKKELHAIFLPLIKEKETLSPDQSDIFEKAYDHILKLIEKDSYTRFCKTQLKVNNNNNS